MTVKQLIEDNFKIFDFEYDMQPSSHKPVFEELFTRHFYFREIGFETPSRWKYHLETELKKLMNYYNRLYMSQALEQRILDNYDVKEEFTREQTNNRVQDESLTGSNTGSQTSNGENLNQFSDTPVKRTNIASTDFISNLSKDTNSNSATSTNSITNELDRTQTDEGTEHWVRTMQGNIGVQTDADAVIKYETSLKNVDMLLLGELENLFMGVW